MGRLKHGVTLPQASADLNVIYRQSLAAELAGPQTAGITPT